MSAVTPPNVVDRKHAALPLFVVCALIAIGAPLPLFAQSSQAALVALFAQTATPQSAPPVERPDEVRLNDGSVLRGRIDSMADGVLVLQSGAAGEVKIPIGNVVSIDSTRSQKFVLKDGRTIAGTPRIGAGGVLELDDAGLGAVPLDLASITAINPPEKKAVRHKGNFAINGRITDGNTRIKGVGATGDYEARSDRQRFTLRGDWNYAQEGDELTARNASGGAKYDYFFTKKLFGYASGSLEGDEFADLTLRSTVGVGVGVQILDGARATWYEETGVSYVKEDFNHGLEEEYAAQRVAGKLDWKVVLDRMTLFHGHEVYFGYEDQDDVLVDTKSGLRFTLVYGFFALLQVNYRWDNTPAPGKVRADTEYLMGVGYSFEF